MIADAWSRGSDPLGAVSSPGPESPPLTQRLEYAIRIVGLAERAVVAPEGVGEVALLAVDVVAQDRAAVAQVGAFLEEVLPGLAQLLHPERHHLHEPARARARHRVLA